MEKFKGSQGHWLGQTLFLETCKGDTSKVLYSLKDFDREYKGTKYPSIRKIFVQLEDPTEYLIATEYFGGWEHWKVLCNTTLKNVIADWRDELEVRVRAKGLKTIRQLSEEGDRQAAKILLDKGWEKRTAGAPSKQEKENHLKQQAQVLSMVDNDLRRVMGDDD